MEKPKTSSTRQSTRAHPPTSADSSAEAAKDNLPAIREVLRRLPEAFLLVDRDLRILYANEAAGSLLRVRGRIALRRLDRAIGNPQVAAMAAAAMAEDRTRTERFALPLPGSRRPPEIAVRITVAPVHAGAIACLMIQAESGESGRTPLPETTLTDLWGPLSIVQGYLENLLEGLITGGPAVRRSLLAMQKNAARIGRILESLRD